MSVQGERAGSAVGRAAGRLARHAAGQLLGQGLRALLAAAGPAGLLTALGVLALLGLFYAMPAAARGGAADPRARAPQRLWQRARAAGAAALPPVRSVDGAERNWPVDPGWLAALAVLAAADGRPVAIGAWAAELAPTFTYLPSTVATTSTPPARAGEPAPGAKRSIRAVLLLATADTALGTARRRYVWVTETSRLAGGALVRVRRQVPVATTWEPDPARLQAVLQAALGQAPGTGGLQAFLAVASAWDDPAGGLLQLLVPSSVPDAASSGVLARVRGWLPLIDAASASAGISPQLVAAVVAAESGGDPGAISPAGAEGLMQVEPATGMALGIVDLLNPAGNLRAGSLHLAWLLGEYGFGPACWPARGAGVAPACRLPLIKAIAAYNAGEAAVDAAGGVPPFPETQAYVRRVLGYYAALRAAPSAP